MTLDEEVVTRLRLGRQRLGHVDPGALVACGELDVQSLKDMSYQGHEATKSRKMYF
jgi:hypothetical protein